MPATPLALALLEVVTGQFHLLTTEQSVQLLVEQGNIQGVEVLKVVVATLVEGGLVAVLEIVVQRDAYGLQPVDGQLDADALAGSRLTTGRRTCNEHHSDAGPMGYLVGYLGYLLLLQGLADLYQFVGMSLTDGSVEVAHGTHT